jgi:peptide/nickel transport system permease protein
MEGGKEDYEVIRRSLGFDKPLHEQYWNFISNAVQGDFGRSLRHRNPALPLVVEKVPATVELALASMLIALVIAVPLGVISATKRGSLIDSAARVLALSGQCIPTFWLGVMLILVFSVYWPVLPVFGRSDWRSLILPAVTLAAWAMARTARLTRSSMLEVLGQDYLRTARAKGLSEGRVIISHALKNAAIPVVTGISLDLGNLLSGAIITEAVFAYPGIGRLSVEAVINKDIPLIQAVVFIVALMFVLINLITDILYLALNPQVRLAQ